MSKTFTAIFKLTDQVSSAMDRIANAGTQAVQQWENVGQATGEVFDGLVSSATTTAHSLNNLTGDIADFQNAIDGANGATDSFLGTVEDYSQDAERTADRISELAEASRESEEALEAQARAADTAAEHIEDYSEETESASENSEDFGDTATGAIQDLSTLIIGAGIVAGLKEVGQAFLDASDAAGEFEVAIAKVTTVADTSRTSIGTIARDIKELSLDTGEAVGDLSEATYQAISASVDTAGAVEFTGTATKLAVGGFTQAATAVDVLTTAINAYGLSASAAEQISDMLVTTQNLGKTSVDQLAQSVGKVIPLAAAYNVEMDNLSAAYAELTKGGIATAEAGTYLKAMLSELGDSGSQVSAVLLEETGQSFAQLMEQGYSLGDVLGTLGGSVDGDSTKFNELWSSTEAGIGALALFNAGADQFNTTLDAMQNSTGATAKAYATMTDTTVHAQQEMTNASKNLQIAIGEDLNPIMENLYDMGTRAFSWAASVTEEHPAITAAISAIAIAVGVVAVAVTGFALVTCPTVVTAINTVTAAMMANPIFLIITGVVALTAAVVAFVTVLASQESEYESWTASTRRQYDELQALNAEYDEACEKYGETSEEASRLKYEMDELNAEFEANKQTVEEFVTECDALVESHNKLMDDYEATTRSLREEELGTLALIQKLEDLAAQNMETAGTHEQMEAIIAELNEQLPDLALSYDEVTNSTEATVEAIRKAAEAQANQERQAEQREAYVELLKEQAALEEQIAKAEANLNEERAAHDMTYDEITGTWSNVFYAEDSLYADWTTDLSEYNDALNELNAAYVENQAAIQSIEEDYANIAAATQEAAEQTVSYEDAVNTTFSSVEEQVTTLVDAYNSAYEAARTSIDGQIGLFDTMSVEGETSTQDMLAALQSQTEYLNSYTENLQRAAELGLDEGLVASLSDGSEESAAYLDTIIGKIDELGGSTDEAKQFIDEMNTSFTEVESAKESFASAVAEMETDFTEKMDAIELEMQSTIEGLNMETDAAAAATATIQAYTKAIQAQKGSAVTAAEQVASAVSAALSSSSPTVTSAPKTVVPGHATGTTNAEDVFIAGEDGPELIIGQQGSTVFPTEETERILGAVQQPPLYVEPPTGFSRSAGQEPEADTSGGSEKRIVLEIAGSGAIEASGSNKDQILDVLVNNLRPVLMNLIQSEIYEEGELSYEF